MDIDMDRSARRVGHFAGARPTGLSTSRQHDGPLPAATRRLQRRAWLYRTAAGYTSFASAVSGEKAWLPTPLTTVSHEAERELSRGPSGRDVCRHRDSTADSATARARHATRSPQPRLRLEPLHESRRAALALQGVALATRESVPRRTRRCGGRRSEPPARVLLRCRQRRGLEDH